MNMDQLIPIMDRNVLWSTTWPGFLLNGLHVVAVYKMKVAEHWYYNKHFVIQYWINNFIFDKKWFKILWYDSSKYKVLWNYIDISFTSYSPLS